MAVKNCSKNLYFIRAEVRSSVTAGDENKGGKLSERQCPALRESVFRLARDVMLSTKTAANKLLDMYPFLCSKISCYETKNIQ